MENNTDKINILLVDDNPGNLLSLETILQAPDRNLVRAASGEEALKYLLEEDAAVSQGYSLGAVDYIIKPIDPEALKSKVSVFVELYRKTEQIKQQAELLREQNIEMENANLQRLSRLIDLGQELAAERDPERLIEKYCDAARKIVGARFATVGILEEDGVTLRHFSASGFDRAAALDAGFPQVCQEILVRIRLPLTPPDEVTECARWRRHYAPRCCCWLIAAAGTDCCCGAGYVSPG